jgi:hypothetical protein
MDAKQLKCCLRALGFAVDAAEARALVYEFDYNDTQTIGLVDFQRIYLFKVSVHMPLLRVFDEKKVF